MTVYGQTQNFMKGFVFLLMAGFHAISALIFMYVLLLITMNRSEFLGCHFHVCHQKYMYVSSNAGTLLAENKF